MQANIFSHSKIHHRSQRPSGTLSSCLSSHLSIVYDIRHHCLPCISPWVDDDRALSLMAHPRCRISELANNKNDIIDDLRIINCEPGRLQLGKNSWIVVTQAVRPAQCLCETPKEVLVSPHRLNWNGQYGSPKNFSINSCRRRCLSA